MIENQFDMGVRGLNQFINNNCRTGVKNINIFQLKGKTIVIDINMYLYQFKLKSSIVEGLYELIITMNYFMITPVFIFDGESPIEKKKLLSKNKEKKQRAEERYNKIKNNDVNGSECELLKRKFIRMTTNDMNKAKELIKACGFKYYVAPGEAEQLCAKLVKINMAYACLSEDSDLFLYGCPRIIKSLDMERCMAVSYDLKQILYDLNIDFEQFKELAVLCGTDYNFELAKHMNIRLIHSLYLKYCNYKSIKHKNISFYDYLNNHKNNYKLEQFCKICDYNNFYNVLLIFSTNNLNINMIKSDMRCKLEADKEKMKDILKEDNFIYV